VSTTSYESLLFIHLSVIRQVILRKMMEVDEIAAVIPTMIPRQAVEYVQARLHGGIKLTKYALDRDLDNTHHPGHVVKERIEAVSLENAFLNGKISAVSVRFIIFGSFSILINLSYHFPCSGTFFAAFYLFENVELSRHVGGCTSRKLSRTRSPT
jgi:hypothetical protein